MSRKTLDGPAGMIGGAYLPSAALLHEAKLGEDSFTFITFYISLSIISNLKTTREKRQLFDSIVTGDSLNETWVHSWPQGNHQHRFSCCQSQKIIIKYI